MVQFRRGEKQVPHFSGETELAETIKVSTWVGFDRDRHRREVDGHLHVSAESEELDPTVRSCLEAG